MNVETELDRTDRATLTTWRVLNVAGWAAVALLVTIGLHSLADAVTTGWLSGCCGATSLTFNAIASDEAATAGHFALRAGLSIGLGALIGTVIGPRVARKPILVATAVAFIYVALAMLTVHGSGGGSAGIVSIEDTATGPIETLRVIGGLGWTLIYDALIAITVPVAAWTARCGQRARITARPGS